MSPFLNLRREVFGGEVMVLASHVVSVEIALSRTTAQLVLGLANGRTLESHVFEPTDQTIGRLRELRDEVVDDLTERLSAPDAKPSYAQLPPAGA